MWGFVPHGLQDRRPAVRPAGLEEPLARGNPGLHDVLPGVGERVPHHDRGHRLGGGPRRDGDASPRGGEGEEEREGRNERDGNGQAASHGRRERYAAPPGKGSSAVRPFGSRRMSLEAIRRALNEPARPPRPLGPRRSQSVRPRCPAIPEAAHRFPILGRVLRIPSCDASVEGSEKNDREDVREHPRARGDPQRRAVIRPCRRPRAKGARDVPRGCPASESSGDPSGRAAVGEVVQPPQGGVDERRDGKLVAHQERSDERGEGVDEHAHRPLTRGWPIPPRRERARVDQGRWNGSASNSSARILRSLIGKGSWHAEAPG